MKMTLKVAGQGTSTTNKLSCVDAIYRQVREVITYNFCSRTQGSTVGFLKNSCFAGGDVIDATFTYFQRGPNRYNYKKKSNYPYWVKPTATFSQAQYDELFKDNCIGFVPLVHSTMQWREVDLATNTWKDWHTKWKPTIPKKSNPLAWGKAITCPPV